MRASRRVEDDELREYCFQAFQALTAESDDEYSDDMSWKVRRSSVKCLEAVISTRRDLLVELYGPVAPALLAQFKQRENFKTDIFVAFVALLKQTRPSEGLITAAETGGKEDPVPTVVKALHEQLKEKSMKSRQGCFCLLTDLANILPGALGTHTPARSPGGTHTSQEPWGDTHQLSPLDYFLSLDSYLQYRLLTDKSTSSNMKINALSFLYVLLCSHPPDVFHPHIKVILPPHKLSASTFDVKPYVKDLFAGTLKRTKAADIDQEVKERAISCMGHVICHLGDQLGGDLQPTQQIFLERLKNEITRCVATLSSVCPKEASGMVTSFIQEVKNLKSFLCLGEVGRTINLGSQKELKTVTLEAFSSPNEGALGNICVGNLEDECAEGTRNVVAECLGKLTMVNPAQLLPKLKQQLSSGSPMTHITVMLIHHAGQTLLSVSQHCGPEATQRNLHHEEA
ncbi:unnamed protein product [Coregonus sp. 'balchen']|nr:unnamed protein product [Coregonus sp. 'balchen']